MLQFAPMDYAFGAAVLVAAAFAAGHAIVYKRDPRSAALWLLAILLLPAVGPVLYMLFGVNRVQRRALRMRRYRRARTLLQSNEKPQGTELGSLARLVGEVSRRPLLPGNAIEPLVDGKQTYPAMLDAIEGARASVALSSYIFHGNGIGERFVEALTRAAQRDVAVRVLIDDVSDRFSWISAAKKLRRAGVTVGIFNPPLIPARLHAIHLRNHRKILVVDGVTGFTGGMNIDRRYSGEGAFRDLHFRLRGPVVAQLMEVFAEDWHFTAEEALLGDLWFPQIFAHGDSLARGIEAGPDESFERLRWAILGGLNAARHTVRICTPYFVPDTGLISELNAAALRGVEVDILLPEESDLPHLQWAAAHMLWQVLEHGCRVWQRPGPFDHSKLMLVDAEWSLFGSANWDARSLRLNFELNVEAYCRELGGRLERLFLARRDESRPVALADVDARPFPVKLRDGFARLFAPLL
jgi:cardiolipin synthase